MPVHRRGGTVRPSPRGRLAKSSVTRKGAKRGNKNGEHSEPDSDYEDCIAERMSAIDVSRGQTNACRQPMQRYDYGVQEVQPTGVSPVIATVSQSTRDVGRNLIEKYTGSSSELTVNEWLDVFHAVTLGYNDPERLQALPRYLGGVALKWLAVEVIPKSTTMSWIECRRLMVQRFGKTLTNPLVEASQRCLQRNETVTEYYDEMRGLMMTAGIAEEHQAAFLTRGMPDQYRMQIAGHAPQTCAQWLRIALSLEEAKHSKSHPYRQTEILCNEIRKNG